MQNNKLLRAKPLLAMNFAPRLPAGRQAHLVSLSQRDPFSQSDAFGREAPG
jgi:hypothetical protein